jgi:uncharacterized membrane protein
MAPNEERTWASMAHVIPLACSVLLGGFGWLAAIVIYFAFRERSQFVAFHAKQEIALHLANFVLILACVAMALTIVLIPLAIVCGIVAFFAMVVLPIVGAVKAGNGEWYRLPVVGGFA